MVRGMGCGDLGKGRTMSQRGAFSSQEATGVPCVVRCMGRNPDPVTRVRTQLQCVDLESQAFSTKDIYQEGFPEEVAPELACRITRIQRGREKARMRTYSSS